MGKKKELLKNFGIIFIGKACTQLISFLLIPLYTTYLSTGDYGLVDLIITYISLFVPVITLELEMSIFRFLVDIRNNENEKKKLLSTTFNILIRIILLFILVSILIINFINIKYGYLMIINIIICIFSNFLLQIARGLGNTLSYSLGSCISGITTIILNVILIAVLKIGASGMLISMIVANSITVIYLFIHLKIYKYIYLKNYDKKIAKEMLKYSIPLIPNSISWWIMNVSDRTIISLFLSVSANGIYAISNKFSTLYLGIFSMFSLVWTEHITKYINDSSKKEYFSEIINMAIKVFSSICLLVISIMPFIFSFIVNDQYIEAYLYIPILMLSSLANVVVGLYSGIYIAKKLTKQVMNTSIVSALLNIIINISLINYIGLYAASISTLISYVIMMIYRNYDLKKYIRINYNFKDIIIILILIIINLIVYYLNYIPLNIINLILLIFVILILNRKEIKWIFINLTNYKKKL